jgi:hypothetical protein
MQPKQDGPRMVPMRRNPSIGDRFMRLNTGMTALVTISIISVSSLAPLISDSKQSNKACKIRMGGRM